MAYWINEQFKKKFEKSFRPAKHRELSYVTYITLKAHGEGIHYCNIKSRDNNFIAIMIGKIAQWFNKKSDEDISLTHTIPILLSEDLKSWFTEKDWKIVSDNWDKYYGGTKKLDSSIKALVLASADDNGMNFFDFSKYQTREYSLRKLPLTKNKEKKIIKKLVAIESAPYDITGMVFWWLYKLCKWFKFLDDPKSYFCSELYEIIKDTTGFKIAEKDNPSPLDIENYRLDLRYYVTKNFLKT
jgi:hypothetical protein